LILRDGINDKGNSINGQEVRQEDPYILQKVRKAYLSQKKEGMQLMRIRKIIKAEILFLAEEVAEDGFNNHLDDTKKSSLRG